jgi:sulfide-dependent adenosine diphosphate thiazole synthase
MEKDISTAILSAWTKKLQQALTSDVVITGAGPSGLICAAELAKRGLKTSIIEQKLAPGGGMWGGAMLFNEIVVQKSAIHLLEANGISYKHTGGDLYTADSCEATSALIYNACHNGATLFNAVCVEDLVITDNTVTGVVINWAPVYERRMHVDPLCLEARTVLDATGHPCEVVSILTRKNNFHLTDGRTELAFERSMNASMGEKACVEHTGEVFPGLFVSGMAACGVSGSNRMGPIFGGMLLSGMKAAELIAAKLGA